MILFSISLTVLASHNPIPFGLGFCPRFVYAYTAGDMTPSRFSVSDIFNGLIPEAYISNIRRTIGAVSSSMTGVRFLSVPILYPYAAFLAV